MYFILKAEQVLNYRYTVDKQVIFNKVFNDQVFLDVDLDPLVVPLMFHYTRCLRANPPRFIFKTFYS